MEVVKLLLLLASIRTSKKEILLFLFISWVKLRTELFWKVSCSMLISLILLVRIRMSSTYLRYIKLVIYYNKFKTSNLVIRNNSSPSIGVLQKTNVIYKFKCPLGDCISDNNNIYVGLTSTTLSRRLTMHLSDTSSIAQHLKKHSCPTTQLRKILTDNTTILEHQNNKQKLQILEALHIRNLQPTLNRINFQTSANVLKCL